MAYIWPSLWRLGTASPRVCPNFHQLPLEATCKLNACVTSIRETKEGMGKSDGFLFFFD